jgi:hypothetical protein
MFWARRDILGARLATVGEDGALMKLAAVAMAGRFAALSAQGVDGAGQERLASEGGFEECRQEFLEVEELGAKGTEGVAGMVHGDALRVSVDHY